VTISGLPWPYVVAGALLCGVLGWITAVRENRKYRR
jgi:hypothetical protein